MSRSTIQISFLAISFFALMPPGLLGQTERGTIVGTVTDSQGAVVAGATVTITHLGTNVGQTYRTNAEGLYEAPFLTPGAYRVSATFSGFSTSLNNNVKVSVGGRARVDLTLQVDPLHA